MRCYYCGGTFPPRDLYRTNSATRPLACTRCMEQRVTKPCTCQACRHDHTAGRSLATAVRRTMVP